MHDDYEVREKIGQGRYSTVYDGYNVINDERVVVKILKPVKTRRIKREIKILENLKDGPNIVKFKELIIDHGSKTPSIIYEYLEVENWKEFFQNLGDEEIRIYLYKILKVNLNII
jgi:casein kinase II subunit alpha